MNARISRMAAAVMVISCIVAGTAFAGEDLKSRAVAFIDAVYACDPDAVAELAADDIVISYPIFEKLFGSPTINGRDAAVSFAKRFCERWDDAEITVHDAIAEGKRVALVWTFTARSVAPGPNGEPPSNEMQSWGGITVYHFDDEGKVTLEFGEESDPGPTARTSGHE